MNRILLFLTLFALLGCSNESFEKFEPTSFNTLHLTSIETEKRHEERLWVQMRNSYNRMVEVAPDSVASRDQFNEKIESMKRGFIKNLTLISEKMLAGDRLYYYVQETDNGTEFGYLIERDGKVLYNKDSTGIVWD